MKILILSHMFPSPANEIAGIFVWEQVKALRSLGCELQVVSPVPLAPFPVNLFRETWKRYARLPAQRMCDDLEVYHPRYVQLPHGFLFSRSGEWLYSSIRKLITQIRREFHFNLIHAHVALPEGYAAAVKLKRDLGIPVFVTVHGKDMAWTFDRGEACRRALQKTFVFADRVITVSPMLRDRIEAAFPDCPPPYMRRILSRRFFSDCITGMYPLVEGGWSDGAGGW